MFASMCKTMVRCCLDTRVVYTCYCARSVASAWLHLTCCAILHICATFVAQRDAPMKCLPWLARRALVCGFSAPDACAITCMDRSDRFEERACMLGYFVGFTGTSPATRFYAKLRLVRGGSHWWGLGGLQKPRVRQSLFAVVCAKCDPARLLTCAELQSATGADLGPESSIEIHVR